MEEKKKARGRPKKKVEEEEDPFRALNERLIAAAQSDPSPPPREIPVYVRAPKVPEAQRVMEYIRAPKVPESFVAPEPEVAVPIEVVVKDVAPSPPLPPHAPTPPPPEIALSSPVQNPVLESTQQSEMELKLDKLMGMVEKLQLEVDQLKLEKKMLGGGAARSGSDSDGDEVEAKKKKPKPKGTPKERNLRNVRLFRMRNMTDEERTKFAKKHNINEDTAEPL
jgi:hypothetical protein